MDRDDPIAVLVPWGSRKVLGTALDIAELYALRQLLDLNERVRPFYSPGILVDIGIEDLGGWYLWKNDISAISDSMAYVTSFVKLVDVLDSPHLMPIRESSLVPGATFNAAADTMYERLHAYFTQTRLGNLANADEALLLAQELGWQGNVPPEQSMFYLRQYERHYPTVSNEQRWEMLARYLAQSWARYRVNAKLRWPGWGSNYVQVNFPQPVPGIPASLGDRRLFYRTLSTKHARTHIPPWRAKGYFSINGAVAPKLASSHDAVLSTLTSFSVALSNGRDAVTVNADYVVTP
jgi:hypothetical protein